ncbi:hypothetical protein GCK32_002369 [Trichostrongylus colubriformis]|uniref:Uncharacterized protein n=1 Tax=Trichostrongylus colubriformis TaxID=6319 RepID=A0AAN8FKL1_TRICO
MRFALSTVCFTSTTVNDVHTPTPVIVTSSSRPPTQWIYGNGSIKSMPRRLVPFYLTTSSSNRRKPQSPK